MSGDAVVATVTRFCAIDDHPPLVFEMTPSSASRELRWANGRMTAHLDVGPPLSTELYMGRLAGTAPVAEHTHPTSWEVLAALEGSGIFTLDGREQRLVAPQLVVVPPNTKHAWKPDPGTRLQAIQVYAPPGPEQRFLALDAAAGDGGAPR
jgi:quercetin dioxygenase-like cupin family protein